MSRKRTKLSQDLIKSKSAVNKRGCWIWQGTIKKSRKGYGQLSIGNKSVLAHRASYEVFNNTKLTKDILVMHTCDSPACVNPSHLVLGSHADNQKDKCNKNRQARGDAQGHAKLTKEEVRQIYLRNGNQYALAKEFNTTQGNVSMIKRKINWKWYTDELDKELGLNATQ